MYWILLGLFVCLTFYLILRPVYFSLSRVLWPCKPITIETARNYYATLSSVYTIIFGFIGIILGFIYFIGRKRFDADNLNIDQIRKRLDLIISKLDCINQITTKILLNCSSCSNDKNSLMAEIMSTWQTVSSLLENNSILLSLTNLETDSIVLVYSIIEQEILYDDLSKRSEAFRQKLTQKYIYSMRQARIVLYNKYP